MRNFLRKAGITTAGLVMAIGIVLGGLLGTSQMARADETLTPDPAAWCIQNEGAVFGLQQNTDDWQVHYSGLIGDAGQNDWRCGYQVWPTIPAGGDTFSLVPPFNWSVPMNWEAMCEAQFSGAHVAWINGPLTGVGGAPWQCIGAPGVTYDPAEQADGTHAVL